MNEELRKKYQLLKEKNKEKVRDFSWKSNVLFTECVDILHGCKIISLEETERLFEQLRKNFPMTKCGCIDWNYIKMSLKIHDVHEIKNVCDVSAEYYILWDQKGIPFVRCQLMKIIDNLDDVLAVSFDTWILSYDGKEVIEFQHEGNVTYGRVLE